MPLAALVFLMCFFCVNAWAQGESRLAKINYTLDRFEQTMRVAPVSQQASVVPNTRKSNVKVSGSISEELARHLYGNDHFSKMRSHLTLDAAGIISSSLRYRLSGRFYYDGVYNLNDYYPSQVRHDQQVLAELRDSYVDYSQGPWDLRLGKQQVVWGEAVGLFVADVVNPKDLREFILPDFDFIRIPEWGADLEYTYENFHSEFIFIPAPAFDKLSKAGADFTPPLPVPDNTSFTYLDADKPRAALGNSKWGTRLSYLVDGLDLGAFFMHHWTNSPVLYRTINGGVYDFAPGYQQVNTMGLTFSNEIKDVVFKGEFAYTKRGYFSVLDPANTDGIATSDYLDYMLGISHAFSKINADLQFVERIITDHQPSFYLTNKVNNLMTLRLERAFLNNKLDAEVVVVAGLDDFNFLYKPNLKYNLSDNWQVKAGADMLGGDADTPFGFYRNKSRYYLEVKRTF